MCSFSSLLFFCLRLRLDVEGVGSQDWWEEGVVEAMGVEDVCGRVGGVDKESAWWSAAAAFRFRLSRGARPLFGVVPALAHGVFGTAGDETTLGETGEGREVVGEMVANRIGVVSIGIGVRR